MNWTHLLPMAANQAVPATQWLLTAIFQPLLDKLNAKRPALPWLNNLLVRFRIVEEEPLHPLTEPEKRDRLFGDGWPHKWGSKQSMKQTTPSLLPAAPSERLSLR